ncbi:hypothetical protein TNCV_3851631 [Trichonephila clavipes]|nr:hypothetical protein TNCV_3851631 [Trichonephila clavipes]
MNLDYGHCTVGLKLSETSSLFSEFASGRKCSEGMGKKEYKSAIVPTRIFGSYCQKKQTEHSIRLVSSALFSYRYDSFKADRVQTLRAHWSICSYACQMCSTYRNSPSPAINLE